jgi:hypothetical protein
LVKEQGSYNPVQNMGYKGPVLRSRCIGPLGARKIPFDSIQFNSKVKVKIKLPLYKPDRPCGFREDKAPRLHDSWYIKVLSLSALRTGHLYTPGNIAGTNLFWRLSGPQDDSAAGRIMSIKIPVTPWGIELTNFRLVAQ